MNLHKFVTCIKLSLYSMFLYICMSTNLLYSGNEGYTFIDLTPQAQVPSIINASQHCYTPFT